MTSAKSKSTILWLRNDLRLNDQPAFVQAALDQAALIPVFIWAPEEEGSWPLGGASRWWLHYSLKALQEQLHERGLQLVIRRGPSLTALKQLISETGADTVFWTRRYEPYAMQRDASVKAALRQTGIRAESFKGQLLFEPWTVFTKERKPYQVFTPFWKSCLTQQLPRDLLGSPELIPFKKLETVPLNQLELLPKIHWDKGLAETWQPGEQGALERLNQFKNKIGDYAHARDVPGLPDGVSHLSPHLHFGEISPYTIWNCLKDLPHADVFLRQLGWREFAHHVLYHFPFTTDKPMRPSFQNFPWKKDQNALINWQKGTTGYPIVDAGMRELWTTGWMHNRVRMLVGSFLVKDLMLPWQEGAKWFWDTLVDADMANNSLGWQWVAGSGADAAPYFRIFNPTTQGEKFDPQGVYVRKWIPELKALPNKWIHRPWEAPQDILQKADVILGESYPYPLVDHDKARLEALQALKSC